MKISYSISDLNELFTQVSQQTDSTKETKQIFARRRLTYDCTASLVEKDNPEWMTIADKFAERFGNIIDALRNLPDFRIFKLTPYKGLFVIGFGAAYRISGENLDDLMHITGNGHGHSKEQWKFGRILRQSKAREN